MERAKKKQCNTIANEMVGRQRGGFKGGICLNICKGRISGTRCDLIVCVLLSVITLAIYSNTFHSPFILDDSYTIVDNPHIRITDLSWKNIIDSAIGGPCKSRPMAMISFAFNYYFGQYNVMGYHLVNIVIHFINGILLFFFVRTTLNSLTHQKSGLSISGDEPSDMGSVFHHGMNGSAIAFFCALLWLVNPLHTNSVTYIVQRMNSMAAMFYVLAMLCYAKGRIIQIQRTGNQEPESKIQPSAFCLPSFYFALAVISGLCAMGCKEIAATLPFFIILYEWYFFRDLEAHWIKRCLWWVIGAVGLVAIIVAIWLYVDPMEIKKYYPTLGRNLKDFSIAQRLFTESRVVVYYITLLLFPLPSRLNLDYDFPISHSLITPVTTLFSMLTIAGMISLAIYLARKERIISFCILWFFGNLVIESTVIPLALIFEHRTYLPSMLFLLAILIPAYRYIRKKWLIHLVLCLTVVLCAVWTFDRNKVWKDEMTLWQDCVEKSPGNARAHNGLGCAVANLGKMKEAICQYSEALRIDPDYDQAHINMGVALEKQGKTHDAVRHFYEALRINPQIAEAHNNLGLIFKEQGNMTDAISHLSEALRINPDYADAHFNLGIVLEKMGKTREAICHYQKALQLNPHYAEVEYNLAVALQRQGRIDEAINHYSKALQINPQYAEAHNNLGRMLAKQGRANEAIRHYQKALQINPGLAEAHNNLGLTFGKQGKLMDAVKEFSEAVRIKPDYDHAHNNLGVALLKQGKISEAATHFSEAVQINPGNRAARNNLRAVLAKQRAMNPQPK